MINKSDRQGASNFSVIGNVLVIVFLSVIVVSYARTLFSGYPLTFQSIIERLSNVRSIPIPTMDFTPIENSWGALNFIRDFLNSFTSIFAFGVWFSISAVNSVMFLLQLIPIFLGA